MRQIAVIGLGNFGYYLAKELYSKGFDVIGLDLHQEVVHKVKNDLNEAVIADATDKDTLMALGIDHVDLAVVTIGTNMLASILVTFHLKQMGVDRVYAKALSEEHGQILSRMGADEILFPEKDLAISLARHIENPNMLEYLPSIGDHGIFELTPPRGFLNKTLRELDLINQFSLQIIAVKHIHDNAFTFIPKADFKINENHVLLLLGTNQAMEKLSEEFEE
ncbi:potassium channel family protein [Desulfoferrobacter suflitae]|uniref:potassium channel family protein n=1 Tax=Desulfoferrobacter suflitae TaxID=2865782 RepID=UPI0021641317|nr:TrkA family potassium uptake protein [Desulfoferrobacter suflitae]MCK8601259.1 TrkA family potassium uptake protein [Desulfoferrobacter suflitae]